MEWKDLEKNSILEADDWYISYNPLRHGSVFDDFLYVLTGVNYKLGAETAICTSKPKKWYILCGDHRKEYEKLFPDLEACMCYYRAHLDQMHPSSNKEDNQTPQ